MVPKFDAPRGVLVPQGLAYGQAEGSNPSSPTTFPP